MSCLIIKHHNSKHEKKYPRVRKKRVLVKAKWNKYDFRTFQVENWTQKSFFPTSANLKSSLGYLTLNRTLRLSDILLETANSYLNTTVFSRDIIHQLNVLSKSITEKSFLDLSKNNNLNLFKNNLDQPKIVLKL